MSDPVPYQDALLGGSYYEYAGTLTYITPWHTPGDPLGYWVEKLSGGYIDHSRKQVWRKLVDSFELATKLHPMTIRSLAHDGPAIKGEC